MKKMLSIAAMVLLIWGCAKKVTTADSPSNSSNTGSSSTKPGSYPASTNTSNPASTSAATSPTDAAKTGGAISSGTTGTVSAEVLGQRTFNAKCGRCHGYKVTTDYTRERWISIMQVMAIKANLDETEKANVLAYVTANAKR